MLHFGQVWSVNRPEILSPILSHSPCWLGFLKQMASFQNSNFLDPLRSLLDQYWLKIWFVLLFTILSLILSEGLFFLLDPFFGSHFRLQMAPNRHWPTFQLFRRHRQNCKVYLLKRSYWSNPNGNCLNPTTTRSAYLLTTWPASLDLTTCPYLSSTGQRSHCCGCHSDFRGSLASL